MFKFGETLRDILKANNISVYGLSKYSGVARTSIYKYLDGKTLPKKEFLNSIIDILYLTTKQKRDLYELYKKELYGEEIYLSFKRLKIFIENINKDLEQENVEFVFNNLDIKKQNEVIHSLSIQFYLKKIIENEIVEKGNEAEIYMIIQPNCEYLSDLLYSYTKNENIHMSINQIVSLEKQYDGKFLTSENVNILSKLIISAIFNKNINYNLNYFYQNDIQDKNFNKVFPYFVMADNQIVFLSHDYEIGLYVKDEKLYEYFKKEFKRILEWCSKFIEFEHNLENIINFFKQVDEMELKCSYVFGFQPYLLQFCTKEILLNKIGKLSLIYKEINKFKMNNLKKVCENEKDKKLVIYFTLEGLDCFCKEGRLIGLGYFTKIELKKEEILYVIKAFYDAVKNNQIEAYIINTCSFKIPQNITITSYELDYINILKNDKIKGDINAATIHERGISKILNDFFDDLKNTEDVYGIENTIDELEIRIEKLESENN